MSSYLVLARKYRPKQFSDIVGQQSVVRTLVNAIKLKRTHQAYVFSGSRGIGKTSIARIFSKALRCPNVEERADGLLYSCDHCPDCLEIAAGNSVNVLEIDGASNNGVDSVREIRENAKFLPSSGLFKIYIIDEVHMLSTAAFNALLKTLEEPPEHVVFIFATTESHKIPETILGRCQRFDFKRVTVAQISDRVKEVLRAEKIDFEEASINLIARAAEGSMRDALSILDQVISFSGLKVTAQAIRESIGLIGTELVLTLLRQVLSRNAKDALVTVQAAFNQGVDLKILLKSLIEMAHALILMQVGIAKPESNFNDDELVQLAALQELRPLEELELIFQVFHHGLDLLSRASQPKLIFDLLIIKTALAEAFVKLTDGEGSRVEAASSGSVPSTSNPRREARPSSELTSVRTPAPPPPVFGSSAEEQVAAIAAPRSELNSAKPASPQTPDRVTREVPMMQSLRQAPVESPAAVTPPVAASKTAQTQTTPELPRDSGPRSWEKFIELTFSKQPMLGIILESVVEWTLPEAGQDKIRLGFREKDKSKADQLLQKVFRELFGVLTEGYFGFKALPEIFITSNNGESVAERTEREKKEARDQKMNAILNHEIVQEAKSLFGAELSQIEMTDRD